MVSFQPNEDELSFTEMAKDFAVNIIRPKARDCEVNREVCEEILKQVEDLGLNALELPESFLGLELPLISQVQVLQYLSYGDLGVVQGLIGAGDAASLIRLIPANSTLQLYKNEGRGRGKWPGVAFVDHTDIEDPWVSKLKIVPNGHCYLLDGISRPVRLATLAEYVAVAGVDTQGESVILWLDKCGWQVEEGDVRLGLLPAGIARIHFQSLKVSDEQVVARGQAAERLIAQLKDRVRILQAAKEVGLMDAAIDYATEYTAGRKAFGQEIAKFQGVSFTIAEMAFERQASKNLVWQAATKVDQGAENASGYVLMALYRTHRSLRYVTDSAVQLLGGHGFVQEFPVEKWMRDAETQVVLYGRENSLLLQRGEQIMKDGMREGTGM